MTKLHVVNNNKKSDTRDIGEVLINLSYPRNEFNDQKETINALVTSKLYLAASNRLKNVQIDEPKTSTKRCIFTILVFGIIEQVTWYLVRK